MNVLHIGKYFAPFKGGVETYLRDAMTGLQRQGVRCAALVHDHRPSVATSRDRFDTGHGQVPVHRVGVPFTVTFTPISPAFRRELVRLVRDFRPDVIHVHLPNPSACWLLTVPMARTVPWVIHWHSDVVTGAQGLPMRFLYRLYRPLERALLKRAGAIIATSESYLRTSESLRDFPDKCHVVPLGLDPARFDAPGPGAEPPLEAGRPLQVLAVGRLSYYKGFEYLVRAAALANNVEAHIVGVGSKRRQLERLIARLDLNGRVTLHGRLSDVRLVERLRACDCVCLPSIERTEAFGLVLLEAMLFGKATVVSDVPGSGMGWVVEHGVTGLKVPPADAGELARALEFLENDRESLRRMGMRGRRRFDELFAIDRSVIALVRLYESLGSLASPGLREAQ